MNQFLRVLFFALVVKPVVLVIIGLNIRRRELLPEKGPAIIVANHNSHLDTMTLMSLYPLRKIPVVRPVAAADFFLANRWLKWFSLTLMGIIPLNRQVKGMRTDPLAGIMEALDREEIVILFPEGSRGDPEVRNEFKTGISHVAKRRPDVPLTPVFLHGLGKSLPKGEGLLIPFFADVFVGEPFHWTEDRESFMNCMKLRIDQLAEECDIPEWE